MYSMTREIIEDDGSQIRGQTWLSNHGHGLAGEV